LNAFAFRTTSVCSTVGAIMMFTTSVGGERRESVAKGVIMALKSPRGLAPIVTMLPLDHALSTGANLPSPTHQHQNHQMLPHLQRGRISKTMCRRGLRTLQKLSAIWNGRRRGREKRHRGLLTDSMQQAVDRLQRAGESIERVAKAVNNEVPRD
jgi:hypothetical protein